MRTKKAQRYDDQKIKDIEKAASKFRQSFMSNSKWIRLIETIVDHADEFKKIQNDRIGELYLTHESTFEFDYWQTGFEGNNSFGGWLEYREIEYLIFPKIINSGRVQDLESIQLMIEKTGLFYLETDTSEIRLICYKE